MAEAALKLVETQPVEEKALSIVDQAKAVKVIDPETYTAAGAIWKAIGDMIKEVKETFDPICEAAHQAHKKAVEKRSKYLDPLTTAQKSVKSLMSAYDAEQERIRQAEQRRLEEIARKEEEARRKEEEDRLKAEAEAEELRLLEQAQAAEAAGDKETAEALATAAVEVTETAKQDAAVLKAEPVYVAPVVIPKAVPKMQGGPVYRTVWKARITNESIIPRQYLSVDMVKINGVVRSLKNQANIPGVEAYEERV